MISKEVKQSPIFGEFTPDEANRYFDFSRDRSVGHVDTLYYTVSIYGDDSQEPTENMAALINELSYQKAKKASNYSADLDFFGLNVELTRFVHYDLCLRMNECFDIFISSKFVNQNTPRIVVQLRTRMLLLDGVCQAICKSFRYVEDILSAYCLEVDEVKENRIDYAYHTNLVQNPYKYFSDDRILRSLKSKMRIYHKVVEIGKKIDIDYLSFGHRNSNDIFVRIYNKSREVIEKNYKAFFLDRWKDEKLISAYDYYCYTRAYESKSYVTGLLIGRIDWYLEHGKNDDIKKELMSVKTSSYINSDNTDQLRKIVDSYLPPVTLILNIEYQTKRKFYSSLDEFIDVFRLSYYKNGEFAGFYEKGAPPLFRLFSIYAARGEICNYLTSTSLSFVDNKGTKDEKMCNWWRRINQTYMLEYEKRVIDIWRSHERNTDIKKTENALCGKVAVMSLLQNSGYKQGSFLEDVSDVLCTLNDNDFYGFAANPETGALPTFEPSSYQPIKKRKERQYRSIIKKEKQQI